MLLPILITIVAGYLLGAFPAAYLVARAKGVDIFEHGSKNPGAANVLRVLGEKCGPAGKRLGYLVFALDALKGVIATAWPIVAAKSGLFGAQDATHWDDLALIGLASSLVGHSFSCFTRFKGGKGVSTGAGGFLVLMPLSILFALVVWLVLFELMRYASLSSLVATVSLPVTGFVTNRLWHFPPLDIVAVSALAAVFVAVRHRANIARLLSGTESKFGESKK